MAATSLSLSFLAALAVGVASMPDTHAVGVHKLAVTTGTTVSRANFISAPLLPPRQSRATVASVAGNVITVTRANLPTAANTALGRRTGDGTLAAGAWAQYVVVLRWDANASFPSTGTAGDWWYIDSNTANTLTVTAGLQGPDLSLANGDRIEIVPLVNLNGLFGGPGATVLNQDSNGAASVDEEDVIKFLGGSLGLNFGVEIFFHDGSLTGGTPGYIVNGSDGPYDGSFLTVAPDQAFFLSRLKNTGPVNGLNVGHSHRAPLTHICGGSATGSFHTGFGTGFPVDAAIGGTGLATTAGLNIDNNGYSSTAEEDVIFEVSGESGTSFTANIYRHDGSLTSDPPYVPVWVLDPAQVLGDSTPLMSGKGYLFGRKAETATPLIWREAVPFKL
jgi:hypothetical protein